MPLTVAQVAALPELGLVVRTSSAPLEREVRWVAVSELADPSPWIEPGDLVLTTGMSLRSSGSAARTYVDRLVSAEAAGLGFGVGLSHERVPDALVAAAEAAGLPLLEVPEPVPFVAVSKAVSVLLTAEEYADAAASFESQRRLIRATLGDGGTADAIVRELARHVGGFALLLESTGRPRIAVPPRAAARAGELSEQIERLRPRGLLGSASISTADEHVVVLPIGVRGAAEGFLVVGSPRPLRAPDQSVMNLAVSLLSWEASRPIALDEGMDPWRRLLVSVAADRGLDPSWVAELGIAGLDPRRSVAVVLRGTDGSAVPDTAIAKAHDVPGVVLARRDDGSAIGFSVVTSTGDVPDAVAALAAEPAIRVIGVSCSLDLTHAPNVRQAMDQAERAAAVGAGVRRFGDEPVRGLSSLVDAATASTWATGYLGDLLTVPEGAELTATLRAWLDCHGQVDAAAQRLGIHRHTVRHRLRRAEAVLGRELDDPAVRADLWFALSSIDGGDGAAG